MPERGAKTSMVPVAWATSVIFSARTKWYRHDWWPWTKPGYITMTRRQNNNQWSGGIAAHPAPKDPSAKIHWKSSRHDFWDQDGILLIDYFPKGQTINWSSLLVQLRTFWRKNAAREGLVIARQRPGSPGACNPEETGLPAIPLPPIPWTVKTIERSSFFVRRGGHFCRGDLVERTNFLIFFECLAKLRWSCRSCLKPNIEKQ